MTDWLKVALLIAAVTGWLVGGTKGKYWRRIIYPTVAAFILHLHGTGAWQILGVYLGLVITCSMGYGEGKSWLWRGGVFASYALPSFFLGWHLWWLRLLLTGGGCTLMFWLSRRYNRVDHKLFESTAAWTQAATLIIAA